MEKDKRYLSKPVKIKLRGSDEELEGNFIFTDRINAFGAFKCPVTDFTFIPKDDPATEKMFEFWSVETVQYISPAVDVDIVRNEPVFAGAQLV